MDSRTLLDQKFIEPSELINNKYVVINLPKIYVAADYMHDGDDSIKNLRAIEYEKLLYFVNKYSNILSADVGTCQYFIREIFEDLEKIQPHINDPNDKENRTFIFQILQIISDSYNTSYKFEQNFMSIDACKHLTFDVIRKYTIDPETNLLETVEERQWFCKRTNKYVSFYSQLTDDEVSQVRREFNDTELNRIHYVLMTYENILLFRPNYILDYMIRYLTVSAFMICLCSHSININGFSLNDLIPHYLCYMLDIIIRTRLVTAWQKDPHCRALLKDMAYNYEKNYLSNSVLIEDPIERAKVVLSELKRYYNEMPDPPIQSMLENLDLNDYITLLNNCSININDKIYYEFNTQTFENLLLSGTMRNIKDVCSQQEMREKIKTLTEENFKL